MVTGTAVLIYFKRRVDIILYYKVSFFISVKPEGAAQVPGEVQLVVAGRPPVKSPLVLVKEYFKGEANGTEPSPETLLLGGLVIRVDGIVVGRAPVSAYEQRQESPYSTLSDVLGLPYLKGQFFFLSSDSQSSAIASGVSASPPPAPRAAPPYSSASIAASRSSISSSR